jgi:hypothetical protein
MEKPRPYRAILIGGLIAGTLDITFAFIFYGLRGSSPIRILQSIASGALGANAFTGGAWTAILGGVFHFFIAIVATVIYYLVSRKLTFMINYAVICGVLYGVCIYLFMNFVVLPLSAIPFKPLYPWRVLIPGLLIHMFGIGLPISLVVRRYSR